MKKIISLALLLATVVFVSTFTGCASKPSGTVPTGQPEATVTSKPTETAAPTPTNTPTPLPTNTP